MKIKLHTATFALVAAFFSVNGVAAQTLDVSVKDSVNLTLDQAVTNALRNGDEARIASAQVDAADAQVSSARAAGLPQLRVNSTYSHVLENARAQAVGSIFNQPNTYNANANLSQTVFQGGRIFAGTRAASRVRGAAEQTERETRSQVALDVLRSYTTVLLTRRLLDIQQANYTLATTQLQQVEQLEKAGRAARYDVLRARVDRANLEPLVIQARSDYELAMLDLKRLTNIPIAQPVRLTTPLSTTDVQRIATDAEKLIGTGEERPSLKAAQFTSEARKAGVAVARADFLPTVSVFIQSGFQAFPLDNRFPSGGGRLLPSTCPSGSDPSRLCTLQNGGWFSDRNFGVNISWPLFDGLRAKSNLDVANAQYRIAQLQYAQQRENVTIDVARTRSNFNRAKSLFEARRQNSAEADEAFRLAQLRFSRGLSTQLDVSTAQVALLTAQTNEARATYDLYTASADLARAIGKPIPGLGDINTR